MINISSVNNYYANVFKTGSLSKADAGTAELLSNVFKAKSSYNYQNREGDSLSLSSSGQEKQVMEDLMYMMHMLQGNVNVTQGQIAQNNASALAQTTTISVQSISFQVTSVQISQSSSSQWMLQMPDSVKKFMEEYTPDDMLKISPDQIPDDVKGFAKEVAATRIGGHHRRHHHPMGGINGMGNPDDAAQQLMNSFFADAGNQNVNG